MADPERYKNNSSAQSLVNTLSIHVFIVSDTAFTAEQTISLLARFARDMNHYFKSFEYPWWSSVAPEFGIHYREADGTMFLRSLCRYGSCVGDEWRTIVALLDFTTRTATEYPELIIECWDEDDGPVLLIQASDDLPPALSENSHTGGRYRSWIRKGQIQFLLGNPEKELSLTESLSMIADQGLTVATSSIQNVIRSSSPGHDGDADQWQKTVIVVSDNTATLCTRMPGLVHAAIEVETERQKVDPSLLVHPSNTAHKRVWLPIRLGRTSYAVLRSMVSDSTTNMYLEMGEMIERGITTLLSKRSTNEKLDRRVELNKLIVRCGIDVELIDQDVLLSCPVFDPEITIRCHQAIWDQIQSTDTVSFQPFTGSSMPIHSFEIDSDSWMDVSSWEAIKEDGINSIHKGVKSFLTGDSTAEGVQGKAINCGKVLRILHAALQSSSAEELEDKLNTEFDPFFTKEDYDLADTSSSNVNDDSIQGLMQAMDTELNRNDEGSTIEIMSNLLRSLGSGGPGPTRHLLNEMDETAPNVLETNFD